MQRRPRRGVVGRRFFARSMKPSPSEIAAAVAVLSRAGLAVVVPEPPRTGLSLHRVAAALDCSVDWVRRNLEEFPHVFRLGNELRIPSRDVAAFCARRRLNQ